MDQYIQAEIDRERAKMHRERLARGEVIDFEDDTIIKK